MPKFIKKVLLYAVLFVVGFFLLSVLLIKLFEDQISERLQLALNEQIETDLTFDAFRLSLLSHFPRLSAHFEGIEVEDAFGGLLLEAEDMSFIISPFSLLGQAVKVRSVVLIDGALNIHYDEQGRANYEIFREDESPEGEVAEPAGAVRLSIEEARLRDVQLIYRFDSERTEAELQLMRADFSGDFSADEIALQTEVSLQADFLDLNNERYFAGRKIRLEGQVRLRPASGEYVFEPLVLSMEGNDFLIEGSLSLYEAFSDYDLRVEVEDGNLEGLFLFLPKNSFPVLEGIESRGDFYFSAKIEGRKTASSNPTIRAEFGLSDGRIGSHLLADDFKGVSFSGSFDNGEAHTASSSRIVVEDFTAYLRGELLSMDFLLRSFERPYLAFQLDGTVPLRSLYPIFQKESIEGGMGDVAFERLSIKGRLRDMRSASRMSKVDVSGRILLDDAGLLINGHELFFDGGVMELRGNELRLREMEIEAPGNEWDLEGRGSNILPVLLAWSSGNSDAARLDFAATLKADRVDLDKLLALVEHPVSEEGMVSQDGLSANVGKDSLLERGVSGGGVFDMLAGSFQAEIGRFNYRKIEAKNFHGTLDFFAGNVKVKGDVEAMGGFFELNGTYFNQAKPYFRGHVVCRDIDVKEFFRQNENFGQEVLQDHHLSGRMRSQMSLTVPFDERGNLLEEKLYVLAAVEIEEGELRDFEMLESFSAFVKIEDLRRIRFYNLYNYFEISNRNILIPRMYIQSNAMNMTLSGRYDFDYNYDFYLRVNAAQALANRFKKHDPSLSPIPAKEKGWFNIYYKIWGDLDDYHYKASKREVKRALEQSAYLRDLLRKRLEEEFGGHLFILEPEVQEDAVGVEEYLPEGEDEYLEGF